MEILSISRAAAHLLQQLDRGFDQPVFRPIDAEFIEFDIEALLVGGIMLDMLGESELPFIKRFIVPMLPVIRFQSALHQDYRLVDKHPDKQVKNVVLSCVEIRMAEHLARYIAD
ncbi:hypothetical protein D1872_236460 [compost metagenome]